MSFCSTFLNKLNKDYKLGYSLITTTCKEEELFIFGGRQAQLLPEE